MNQYTSSYSSSLARSLSLQRANAKAKCSTRLKRGFGHSHVMQNQELDTMLMDPLIFHGGGGGGGGTTVKSYSRKPKPKKVMVKSIVRSRSSCSSSSACGCMNYSTFIDSLFMSMWSSESNYNPNQTCHQNPNPNPSPSRRPKPKPSPNHKERLPTNSLSYAHDCNEPAISSTAINSNSSSLFSTLMGHISNISTKSSSTSSSTTSSSAISSDSNHYCCLHYVDDPPLSHYIPQHNHHDFTATPANASCSYYRNDGLTHCSTHKVSIKHGSHNGTPTHESLSSNPATNPRFPSSNHGLISPPSHAPNHKSPSFNHASKHVASDLFQSYNNGLSASNCGLQFSNETPNETGPHIPNCKLSSLMKPHTSLIPMSSREGSLSSSRSRQVSSSWSNVIEHDQVSSHCGYNKKHGDRGVGFVMSSLCKESKCNEAWPHDTPSDQHSNCKDNVKAILPKYSSTTHEKSVRTNKVGSIGLPSKLSSSIIRVEKDSLNPYHDFRESMQEMIMHKGMDEADEMEDLLYYYLKLNPLDLHDTIRNAFSDVWIDIILKVR